MKTRLKNMISKLLTICLMLLLLLGAATLSAEAAGITEKKRYQEMQDSDLLMHLYHPQLLKSHLMMVTREKLIFRQLLMDIP